MNVLITGGAGFIGINVAEKLLKSGSKVAILDNLSRRGSESNLQWLKKVGNYDFYNADITNFNEISKIIKKNHYDGIIHLAAQVAVTTSVVNPRLDFNTNALGTFNLLEAIRLFNPDTTLLYSSTNKVYGDLKKLRIDELDKRYHLYDLPHGISESQALDFYSPYGCSKGAADQYVLDYCKIYGIKTAVFRQSCIYGPRQFGIEDQGWVAWFIMAHLFNKGIKIYGNGKQVRDVLYVKDLVDLYLEAMEKIDSIKGCAFNIGGGQNNSLSILEFMEWLGDISNRIVKYDFESWRPGDQLLFISDNQLITKKIGWKPTINYHQGLRSLFDWIVDNKKELIKFHL